MNGMRRYLASYLLDFFRERVTPEDFDADPVRRVRLVGDPAVLAPIARRLFPNAEIGDGPAEVVLISMSGGDVGARARALCSRARHRLLAPSPDYVYRMGMRAGVWSIAWGVLDRFLLAPVALLWLGVMTIWMYVTGVARRTGRADTS